MQKAVWNGLGEGTSADPFILEVDDSFDINNSFNIKIESNFMGWQNEENHFKFSNSTTVYLLALIIKDRNELKYFMTKNAIDYTFIVSDHMNINEGPFIVTSYLGVHYLLKQQIFTQSEHDMVTLVPRVEDLELETVRLNDEIIRVEQELNEYIEDLDAHNIRFNGSGTNYLVSKTDVESAVKELDAQVGSIITNPYYYYAIDIYGDKHYVVKSAWETSLTIDPYELSVDTTQGYPTGLILYNNMSTEGIIIPFGITNIGENVFSGAGSNNMPLVIPSSVTNISDGAFSYWSANNHPLVIPNSVKYIGNEAFRHWNSNNQRLVIPSSVISIGVNAFQHWTSNNQLLTIRDGVTSIGDEAFQYWTKNNQPLVIPDSVTSIGTRAFQYWTDNNKRLTISNNITSIAPNTFQYWTKNNQPLTIPQGVTSIGSEAFYYWAENNQPLTIPIGVTSIGDRAFDVWLDNNHPLVIPYSVASIGEGAFRNWSSNNHPLEIPNSVTSIGNNAFNAWTSNDKPLTISFGVSEIQDGAFAHWVRNSHPLVIPETVTFIGAGAFQNWSNIPYVEMKHMTPPTLGNSDVFDGQNNAPIYVPDGSVDDYKTATNWVELADRIFPISEKEDESIVDGVTIILNEDDELEVNLKYIMDGGYL